MMEEHTHREPTLRDRRDKALSLLAGKSLDLRGDALNQEIDALVAGVAPYLEALEDCVRKQALMQALAELPREFEGVGGFQLRHEAEAADKAQQEAHAKLRRLATEHEGEIERLRMLLRIRDYVEEPAKVGETSQFLP